MEPRSRTSSMLIACNDAWLSRSIASVFEDNAFSILHAATAPRALALARSAKPDVVVLDDAPGHLDAVAVCRELRDDPQFDPTTPIVITASAHLASRTRTAAYSAGAWEYCSQPLDLEQMITKIGTFLRARRSIQAARVPSFVDAATGLYTEYGMQQVSEHLDARARRNREAFACVALSPEPTSSDAPDAPFSVDRSDFSNVASICRVLSRKSDVVAYVEGSRLAILAPETDAAGARRLVARLQRALDQATRDATITGEFQLRAGYCAVPDLALADVGLPELARRATRALDHPRPGGSYGGVVDFNELPVS